MQPETADLLIENLPPVQPQLRIAVVTETYPPEVNGVAFTLKRLVDGLRERGHQVQLVRPRQRADADTDAADPPNAEVLLRGLPIPRYPHLQLGLPARRQLQALWSRQRPDVVHIATEGPLGWSALRVARKLRIPVTSDFRTNFHAYSSHYGMGWLGKPIMGYLKRFHNQTLTTMVPTAALARQLAAAGFERLQVVGRGVDASVFSPALRNEALRLRWGADATTPVLLCVSRLAREKNLALLIHAYAQARLLVPQARLVVVGDGPAREQLQAQAPDALFTGQLSRAELAQAYASADIFAFPSRTETFGNVVLEAMASGLAVVAFDDAAAAQTIRSGHDGLLAPLQDDEVFVQHVCELVRQPERVRQLGTAARQTALQADWSAIIERVAAILQEASAQPAGGVQRPRSAPAAQQTA